MKQNICVAGGGSWATAIVKILTENGHNVHWWVRRREQQEYIQKHGHNPDYLGSVSIDPKQVSISTDLRALVSSCEVLVIVTPSSFVKDALSGLMPGDLHDRMVVSAVKGLIAEDNMLISDYLEKHFQVSRDKIIALGGPCHAEEVASENRSYLTFASVSSKKAGEIAELFRCRYINVNLTEDLSGFEYAAVLKNIYAITAGICHGAGMGDNFQAVLVSNCIREMHAFIDKTENRERNLLDTAYLGDLLVTAYSRHSRNRTFGNMIGRGYSVKTAQLEMKMIAEGYYALGSIKKLIDNNGFSASIIQSTYDIIYENKPVGEEVSRMAEKLI